MGGGILQQYEIDHPADLASLTLIAPLSPYGFGGTRGADGTLDYADRAGSGGGTAAPDFVRRLAAGDASDSEPMSSPRVIMRSFFWSPRHVAPDEDELVAEVLLTSTGDEFYPGGGTPSAELAWHWARGCAESTTPWRRAGAIPALSVTWKRPVPLLWIRGDEDQVVSDQSMFDFGTLGKLGAVPGWPGEEVFPPQPMIRAVAPVFLRRQGARWAGARSRAGARRPRATDRTT